MKYSLLSAAALAAPLAAAAAPNPNQTLDQVVITGQSGSAVMPDPMIETFVIDEAALRRYVSGTVFDALRSAPGIDVNQNGGAGQVASIFIRGNRSESTLVLIDGVRYGSLSTGSAQLGLIPVDTIERIEIYYGAAAAARYGADATGGVIQLFTKTAKKPGQSGSLRLSAGTLDTYGGSVTLAQKGEQGSFSLTGGGFKTQGINAYVDKSNIYTYEPDDDGYDNSFVSLNGSLNLSQTQKLTLSGLASRANYDFDGGDVDGGSNSDLLNQAAILGYSQQSGDYLLSVSHGISRDQGDTSTIFYEADLTTTQNQSKIFLHRALPAGLLSFGVERLQQELISVSNGIDQTRVINSAVLGATHEGVVELSAIARVDKPREDNTQYNGSLGAAFYVIPKLKVGAQAARSYRLPTFNDLYYPGFSNPDLKAENSRYYEVFSEYASGAKNARLSAYRTEVDNFILFTGSAPQNLSEALLQGVSLTTGAQVFGVDLGLGYDYLDATDEGANKALPFRAKHKVTADAGLPVRETGYASLQLKWTDDRPSTGTNPDLSAYWLANLSYREQLNDWAALTGRLDNLLDEDYQLVTGYGTPGIQASLALDVTW